MIRAPLRRSGVPAERRILFLHFSDGGFLPKAATARGVNAASTSNPLRQPEFPRH
jgi:hypothetical protein